MPNDVKITEFPRTKPAQLKFRSCSVGDVVWFCGGYTVAGNFRSYGKRAKVVKLDTRGPAGGIHLEADCDPGGIYSVRYLITRDNINDRLSQITSEDEKNTLLASFELKPGDLTVPSGSATPPKSKWSELTKAELIAKIEMLEANVAALEAKA